VRQTNITITSLCSNCWSTPWPYGSFTAAVYFSLLQPYLCKMKRYLEMVWNILPKICRILGTKASTFWGVSNPPGIIYRLTQNLKLHEFNRPAKRIQDRIYLAKDFTHPKSLKLVAGVKIRNSRFETIFS